MNEARRLRLEAGLTQAEVSERAAIARPNLSAYESGRRAPSPETLERIRRACRVRPSIVLDRHRDAVREIVARHHASAVETFGSVARGEDRWDSDLDLLVTLDDEAGLLDLVRMQRELALTLGIEVDVVDRAALDPDTSERDRRVLDDAVPV